VIHEDNGQISRRMKSASGREGTTAYKSFKMPESPAKKRKNGRSTGAKRRYTGKKMLFKN